LAATPVRVGGSLRSGLMGALHVGDSVMVQRGLSRGRIAALLLVGVLVLAGCSSGGDDDATTPGDTGGSSGSEIDRSAVLRVGYDLVQDPGGIGVDPLTATPDSNSNDPLWYLIYGRFMKATLDGELEPDLAEKAEIVDNGTIVITLRPGQTFSDGSPFDAAAVKASLDASLASRSVTEPAFQAGFFDLTAVEATTPTTVTLRIAGGKAPSWFDQNISTWPTSIAKVGTTASGMPIGAGPFKFVSKDTRSWVLDRNDAYWNADKVNYAQIELVHVAYAQPQSGLAALQAGQIDVTYTEPALVTSLGGSLESYARTSADKAVQMAMCKADGPLADARVRKAINKAIDREAINEAVYFGTSEPQTQFWPTGHRLNDAALDDELAYDPDGAKQLLQEAGFASGVTLDLYPISAFGIDDAAEVIQQQLAAVGITVKIVPTTDYVAQFLQPKSPGLGMYPSSQAGVGKLGAVTGTGLGNVCAYNNPDLETIATSLRQVSQSSEAAVPLWNQATEIVVEEALVGFIVWRSDIAAYDTESILDMQPLQYGSYLVPDPMIAYSSGD
jgi:peptide/nickel transport system substrate-binding protein